MERRRATISVYPQHEEPAAAPFQMRTANAFLAWTALPSQPMHTSALVLFSGGQDSTTCLAHALSRYERVETLAFDYGQRHKVELDARLNVLAAIKARFPQWTSKMGEDHLLDASILGQIS